MTNLIYWAERDKQPGTVSKGMGACIAVALCVGIVLLVWACGLAFFNSSIGRTGWSITMGVWMLGFIGNLIWNYIYPMPRDEN